MTAKPILWMGKLRLKVHLLAQSHKTDGSKVCHFSLESLCSRGTITFKDCSGLEVPSELLECSVFHLRHSLQERRPAV